MIDFNFLSQEDFFEIIENMYDEIIVYDDNYTIVYINQAAQRHYSCSPEEMIGKTFFDLVNKNWWDQSILPIVYEEKKSYAIKQNTYINCELLTIAVPIFDDNNNIKYVVMNVRDKINRNDLYNPEYAKEYNLKENDIKVITKSESMKKVLKLADKISNIDANCLITGESGTGKSYLAKYIHSISDRKDEPFLSINCASIPNHLIESELFGYKKGAFTGAHTKGKDGLLKAADNGTLLLDEISELSLKSQAKLLKFMQDKIFYPLGSTKAQKSNAKIITTTNKSLTDMIENNSFREDLFYRINVFDIYLPPLRKRKEDIKVLVEYYLNVFCNKYNIKRQLSQSAINVLVNYHWPGNIRELKHILERMVVTNESLIIDTLHLPKRLFGIVDQDVKNELNRIDQNYSSLEQKIDNYEKYIIVNAYKNHDSSRKLAEHLSISQTKANNLIRKHIKN